MHTSDDVVLLIGGTGRGCNQQFLVVGGGGGAIRASKHLGLLWRWALISPTEEDNRSQTGQQVFEGTDVDLLAFPKIAPRCAQHKEERR